MSPAIEITLLNPNRYPEAAPRRLRPWLASLLPALAALAPTSRPLRSCGVRFAGDRAMRRFNREFRGKDRTTDVLSFPGDAGAGEPDAPTSAREPDAPASAGHLGDVVISVPAARRQAAAAGHDTEREIRILLLHGVLHCLGYDHEVDGGEMERLERRLRRRWLGAARTSRRAR
jgi:probable rRNA maturation factor